MRTGLQVAVIALAVALGLPVLAEEPVTLLRGKPTAAEIARALARPEEPSRSLSRGIVLSPNAVAAATPSPSLQPRAIDLEVLFEFDSARLSPDGRDVLDSLAGALDSKELSHVRRVVLEGHTDAKGSAAYNDSLSLLRAQAARQYLVQKHRISPEKMRALGKGKSELADPKDPFGAVNRRVRVIVEGQS